jgi:hypothetical protein
MDVDTTRTRLLAIGQKKTTIAQLVSVLQDSGAMPDTIVVAGGGGGGGGVPRPRDRRVALPSAT